MLFIVATFPVFFVGLLLLYVFAVTLNWLPLSSNYSIGATPSLSLSFIGDVLVHAILPGVALVIVTAGLWIYSMRNNMITTLAEDYVKMGRAKGLPSWRIMIDYAARNAILPNLTGFAMQLGYVLGGSILVEYTFSYPGLGYLFYTSTTDHDLPLMQALFLVLHARRARLRAPRGPPHGRARPAHTRCIGSARHEHAAIVSDRDRRSRRAARAPERVRALHAGDPAQPQGHRRGGDPPDPRIRAIFPGVIARDDPQAAIYGQISVRPGSISSVRRSSARTCSRSSSGARGSR